MRRSSAVFALAVLLLPVAQLPAWRWPVDGEFRVSATQEFGYRYRIADRSELRLVAPGDLVFEQESDRGLSTLPRTMPVEVYRHDNDIWSIIRFDENGGTLEYQLYDSRLDRFVNPRVLLPLEHGGPFEVLPDLLYRQDGVVRTQSELRVGVAEIVALRDGWNPATIPLEISVFAGGRVVSRHRFVYADDLTPLVETDGTLVLAQLDLAPGANEYEIRTLRYDRTPRTRRFDLFIEPPAADSGP